MAERKHAGDPGRFLARPISLASDPVATGRPRPGARARVRVMEEVKIGRATWRDNELLRSCGEPPLHRPGGPIRSSSVAPPKPINQNSPRQILRHPRATRQGIKRTSPKWRRESTPETPAAFWRDPSRWRATP